jgi:hypothetical protein
MVVDGSSQQERRRRRRKENERTERACVRAGSAF